MYINHSDCFPRLAKCRKKGAGLRDECTLLCNPHHMVKISTVRKVLSSHSNCYSYHCIVFTHSLLNIIVNILETGFEGHKVHVRHILNRIILCQVKANLADLKMRRYR